VHLGLMFSPLRPTDNVPNFPDIFGYVRLSFPVLFFAWALVMSVITWRRIDWVARRLFIVLVALTSAFAYLVLESDAWKWLPQVVDNTQFTYRVDTYVLLGTALFVTAAVIWQARAGATVRKWASAILIAILVYNVGGATWQVWHTRSIYFTSKGMIRAPRTFTDEVVSARDVRAPSWYSTSDFRDTSARLVLVDPSRTATVPLSEIRGSHFSGLLDVPDGRAPFITNIVGNRKFVRMTGIRQFGRTINGLVVAVRRKSAPETGPVRVTINQAKSPPIRYGAWASMLSVVALLALLAWPARRFLPARARPRRAGPRAAAPV
jgi:hypothetical protein